MGAQKRTKSLTYSYRTTLQEVLDSALGERLIDEVSMRRLLKEGHAPEVHPLEYLCDAGVVHPRHGRPFQLDELCEWFALQASIPFVRIDPLKINYESVIPTIPFAYAQRLQIVPFRVTGDTLFVATCDPVHREWISDIEQGQGKKVELYMATPAQIRSLLQEVFVVQKAFRGISKTGGKVQEGMIKKANLGELDKLLEKAGGHSKGTSEDSIVQIVDWLLGFAQNERASDIHLEPKKGMGNVRFRIDGKLRTVYKLHPDAMASIISRFKIIGDMKLDERRKPQDGQVKYFLPGERKIEMRLSTIPCKYGEKLVIRIFDQSVVGKDLESIGLDPGDLQDWKEMISRNQGLILVTGPTGSGKTTTLYTSLNSIATPEVNVCTVEDPIEMTCDTFNQVQVNPAAGVNFADCVRAFLRQDPDIIMVGEIRDQETGMTAIQASLTGHLVFSTVHTNGALPTIQRLLDLGLPPYLIKSSLVGVLAQRLVRKLCPHCKEKVPTSQNEWDALCDGRDIPAPDFVYKAKGCKECKETGHIGRTCVYELVPIEANIRKQIVNDVDVEQLKVSTEGLFKGIRENAATKVASGETSIEEVLSVVY